MTDGAEDVASQQNYAELDAHLDSLIASMREHAPGLDPMSPRTTETFAELLLQGAMRMPQMALQMLSLTASRAIQRLAAADPPSPALWVPSQEAQR